MASGVEFFERVGGRTGLSVILDSLKWDDQGLVAIVTQDVETKEVLGVAFANRIAVEKTIETGLMHYYSRSRKKQWMKGDRKSVV
jgi:phosphoribosyl-AMP cyclohydrolase